MGTGITGFIIVGSLFGAIARLFMRGTSSLILVWTVVLGALGAFLGGWIAGLVHTRPGGLASWFFAVLVSISLLSIYGFFNTKE
ncbi:hypothetical protein HMPREF0044_0323 [Gleimia coleocanis DSM 15436]|uniref:Transglycosylase associated protein n=1 Tax=Gleimia coleocanis DSM 15436 TaxID=525245 RepID=C0VYT3_9ACTO|nr:GlsB/YeaQ/YmgE family stress response membrane protein [Gleimia coleocanis]EEH64586.1 hypothetical protein HMPREF0044_0323 [Gleimia coleocanis DSM 15436]